MEDKCQTANRFFLQSPIGDVYMEERQLMMAQMVAIQQKYRQHCNGNIHYQNVYGML